MPLSRVERHRNRFRRRRHLQCQRRLAHGGLPDCDRAALLFIAGTRLLVRMIIRRTVGIEDRFVGLAERLCPPKRAA